MSRGLGFGGVLERVRFEPRWFFLAYLLLGLPYLVLIGPFRVPDERNHFLRSYQISEFRLIAFRTSGGYPGDNLPASLARLSTALGDPADNRLLPEQIEHARSLSLAPGQREFMEFSQTAMYSPLTYLPSAVSIAIGRMFGAGPLALIYCARAANLLVGALLISLALFYAGFARPAALIVALFPMTISQVASVSADSMTYALSFLWIAAMMELAVGKEVEVSGKKIVGLACLALALSQLRPPFPLLGLLVFLIPIKRYGRKVVLVWVAVIAAVLLPAAAWNASAANLYVNPIPEQEIDPGRQLAWILNHGGGFWHRVKQDLLRNALEYWQQLVGRLGWLNIYLPAWIPIGFAAALATFLFTGPREPASPLRWQRIAVAIVSVVGVVAVELCQYLSFNPVHSAFILGVQGRYFVPFAFLAVFAFSNSLLDRPRFRFAAKLAGLLFVASAHLATFFVLARAAGRT